MLEPTAKPPPSLDATLGRSAEMCARLLDILAGSEGETPQRSAGARSMCAVSMEHGLAVHCLMEAGYHNSACGVIRLQFEALTRAAWMHYVATDAALQKLSGPLTLQTERVAAQLPSTTEMLEQLARCVGTSVPPMAYLMLQQFKDVSWRALNSFVHGGIHPLRRQADGFPEHLAVQVLRNTNGLLTMAAMLMAVLTELPQYTEPVKRLQVEFAGCLPELLAGQRPK